MKSFQISISKASRNTAWVSFDGRMRQELTHGDRLCVTTSIYPVPSICSEDQIADWFASLDECLRWNDRKRQKHFDDEDPEENSVSKAAKVTYQHGFGVRVIESILKFFLSHLGPKLS